MRGKEDAGKDSVHLEDREALEKLGAEITYIRMYVMIGFLAPSYPVEGEETGCAESSDAERTNVTPMDLQLKGKVIIVTGGAKGIGAAIARACASEGAVSVIVDRDADAGRQLQVELRSHGATWTRGTGRAGGPGCAPRRRRPGPGSRSATPDCRRIGSIRAGWAYSSDPAATAPIARI